jgi:hypothetical protein
MYGIILKEILKNVSFEIFTAVTMKNVVFWDIKPCSYLTGDTFGLRYLPHPDISM